MERMLTTFVRTIVIYILLTVVMRLFGKRQVGQLEVSELVSTLILSEVAAMPLDNTDIPLIYAIIPILVLLSLEISVTFLKNKSAFLKRVFESRPNILIERGRIRQDELDRVRISVEELMGELRLKGAADIGDVYYAILEQNGQISVFLQAEKQPPRAEDMKIVPLEEGIARALILDGEVCPSTLKDIGQDRGWLEKLCKKRGCQIDEIFLCTVNDTGTVRIIKKEKK